MWRDRTWLLSLPHTHKGRMRCGWSHVGGRGDFSAWVGWVSSIHPLRYACFCNLLFFTPATAVLLYISSVYLCTVHSVPFSTLSIAVLLLISIICILPSLQPLTSHIPSYLPLYYVLLPLFTLATPSHTSYYFCGKIFISLLYTTLPLYFYVGQEGTMIKVVVVVAVITIIIKCIKLDPKF